MTAKLNRPRSAEIYDRALESMPGGNTRYSTFRLPHPTYLERGEGAYVFDVDGRKYLDVQNNFTTLIHGHCFGPVSEALHRQIEAGTCFSNPTESEVRLAELLCERVPYFEAVRFMNTGTEAVMTAIKAARAWTGRVKVAKAEGGYHGGYDNMEISLDSAPETWGADLPKPVPYCRGTPEFVLQSTVVFPYNDQQASEQALASHVKDLACVIIDPIPARVAAAPLDSAYLTWLRDFTRRHDIVLISDEVLSFRVSAAGAMAQLGLEPDLCTFGKIIGGGLPIGALAGRREIMGLFDPRPGKPEVPQAGTFTANPLSMVAGFAAMEHLTEGQFQKLDDLGDAARRGMSARADGSDLPCLVTGSSSMFRIHFTSVPPLSYRDVYNNPAERARLDIFVRACWEAGVLISPSGLGVLSTAMTLADIEFLVECVSHAFNRVEEAENSVSIEVREAASQSSA